MIYLILFLGLILRLINLNQSFWLDEAAQVIESSRPFINQFDLSSDFHPPLFHLFLHFWLYLGKSEIAVRLLSVILGLISIWILYKLVQRFISLRAGLLAALFLTVNPYHIWYSQEARPYMLLVTLTVFTTYFLLTGQYFKYFTVFCLSLFSVYTAPLILIGHLYHMVVYKKSEIKKWSIAIISAGGVFLFWMPKFIRQLQVGFGSSLSGWTNVVSVPFWKLVPLTFAKFIFGGGSIENNILYSLLVFPMVLIFLYGCYVSFRDKKYNVFLAIFLLPLILAQIIAFIVPVMAPQRLLFLLPYFLIITVIGLVRLKTRLFYFGVIIVVLTQLTGLAQYYFSPYVQREQWRQAVRFVESQSYRNGLVIFTFSDAFAPWLWYSRGLVEYFAVAPDFSVKPDKLLPETAKIISKDRIFYFHYLSDLTDPNRNTVKFLNDLGFAESSKYDFPGVGFISIYEKILAKF